MPGEIEPVTGLQYGTRPYAGRHDEHVDILPLEGHDGTALGSPAAVAGTGEGGHHPAASRVAIRQVNPTAAVAEILVDPAEDIAVDNAHILEFEVIGQVPFHAHAGLVVIIGVEPPVAAALGLLGHRLPHPYARSLGGGIGIGDLIGLLRNHRYRSAGGCAGEERQRARGHPIIEIARCL